MCVYVGFTVLLSEDKCESCIVLTQPSLRAPECRTWNVSRVSRNGCILETLCDKPNEKNGALLAAPKSQLLSLPVCLAIVSTLCFYGTAVHSPSIK